MKRFLMKFAKIAAISCIFAIGLGSVVSCDNGSGDDTTVISPDKDPKDPPSPELSEEDAKIVNQFANVTRPTSTPKNDNPTIYCAGDSTVKTYPTEQFIGGWGQFLQLFLDETKVTVKNAANGGRSSRSFINEGRLYDKTSTEGYTYSFSENDRKAIGAEGEIKAGDFLLIQFGHNDDASAMATNASNYYRYAYDRLVPLGEPDANGIYPVTAPTKLSETTTLPTAYTQYATDAQKTTALAEIAKYGKKYYAYDCGGTYKWFLKQYILFARSKGAIPVLVTPVARQSFDSNGKIKSGAGLHGPDFAYVKAVRQLAEEENCLLIDLFAETKDIQEKLYDKTADTDGENSYATFLHAFASNSGSSDLACTAEGITDYNSAWITEYDAAYKNNAVGYNRLDTTHYNKFGAFLQAAKIAEAILKSEKTEADVEYFYFKDSVKTTPKSYVSAPNRISKAKVAEVAALFTNGISVKNPAQTYPAASEVVSLITEKLSGGADSITNENYKTYKTTCAEVRAAYENLNYDDRGDVTNYNVLTACEAKVLELIEANRPKPTETVVYKFDDITDTSIASSKTYTIDGHEYKVVGTSSAAVTPTAAANTSFTYNGTTYTVNKSLSMGGSASFGTSRYIEITLPTGKTNAVVTVVAKSSGSTDRTVNMVDSTSKAVATFDAKVAMSVTSVGLDDPSARIAPGTYQLGSAGSGLYIYAIIVEYYPAED